MSVGPKIAGSGSRYLVTGAAGFIGAAVCHELQRLGHDILAIDNFNDAYDVRLKLWRRDQLARSGIQIRPLDICHRPELSQVVRERPLDGIIHLAARAGVRQSVENPWVYIDTNVTGTLNLLDLCVSLGIRKLVLASTSSAYGDAGEKGPIPETQPTERPLSPYAASKRAAELLCHSYHHLHGLDVSVLRYFTVYGPAGRPDMSLFRFVQAVREGRTVTVFGDGTQSRDFTFVEDIARGTVAALRPLGYEIINLGSDRPWVLRDILGLIESLLGQKARIEHRPMHMADVRATWAQITKAQKLLDWAPRTTAEEGVGALVAWYEAERAWAKDIA